MRLGFFNFDLISMDFDSSPDCMTAVEISGGGVCVCGVFKEINL